MAADHDSLADLAWADALEAAVASLGRYFGRPRPGGSSPEDQEMSWLATAAFAGGLAQLAHDCEHERVPWRTLRIFALRELAEVTKRRAAVLAAGNPSRVPVGERAGEWNQLPLPGLLGERRVHDADGCEPPCPIHAPSDHHMAAWPLEFRPFKQIFERVCDCGTGHPDPDSLLYHRRRAATPGGSDYLAVHGCCATLCCAPPNQAGEDGEARP